MPKNLLIVESPAKAKTIEKYLGKDFTVKSSFGHIRDLEKGNNAVDVDNGFRPKYVVSPEKKKVVKDLKSWVKKVDEVWLATDEDREGEAISWHLCKVLGLDEGSTKRIVFREITKPAILKAVSNPRTVDTNLVNAQQARRILDRLVGFELSGILWKKIRGKLSAGRVQSVALKLIVEREREILKFKPTPYFKLTALFDVVNGNGKKVQLKADSPNRFESQEDAETFLKKCIGAEFEIEDIKVKPLKRRPAPPFTTSTLQQEASRKLGFAVKRTMMAAQRLYEAGHITYMRTDSISLSEMAIQTIAQEIEQSFGVDYLKTRRFKTKKADAQEAHEAIRPTYIQKKNVSGNRDEQRLYELIWKRTIASQMSEALLEKTTVSIGVSTVPDAKLQAVGEVLKFDGFLKVYLESKDDDDEEEAKGMLPPLKVGQVLDLNEMTALERYTRAPARYTEAGLVSKMEELGIGRPSTYAPTISKIMEPDRGYVVKESRDGEEKNYQVLTLADNNITKSIKTEMAGAVKNRLFPTDMGLVVTDFLEDYFANILNYGFTANIEEQFDEIAHGKEAWTKMLEDFYGPFHTMVEKTIETADRPNKERILGTDPDTGHTVLTRLSRNGPVVQIGTPEELGEEGKPRYANLAPGQSMETIEYDEAIKLFALPKTIGEFEGKEVIIGAGRFGPYVKFDEKFISLAKGEDPHKIELTRAIQLIEEKRKLDAPVYEFEGKPVTKGVGRFGPYLKWNNMFINVPKRYNFDELTDAEIVELIEAKIEKEANRYINKWEEGKTLIAVENGRWGPFIRFKKKAIKLPKIDGAKATPESAATLTLEQVKEIIEAEVPGAFKKKAAPKKKTATKKKTNTAKKKS
ncbi:MAG: type I DNA topoisomerase [Bacteroidetes bacterium]|nr:MAG: type I DNA topoisomerase [Bacteroidota bacterium]